MPTESIDRIDIRSNEIFRGLGGADEFYWYSGSASVVGGDTGENYDPNYYNVAKSGGDRLYVMRDTDSKVRFSNTEDGVILSGGQRLAFEGIERLYLGDGDDVVNATSAPVARWGLSIWTEGGNDRIKGSRGGDYIDPGDGNDVVYGGRGEDFIEGSRGDDRIYGGAGNDNIRWGWGNGDPSDVLGNDRLYGGGGNEDLVNVWAKSGWLDSKGADVEILSVSAGGSMKGTAIAVTGGTRSNLKFEGFERGWTHEGKDFVDGSNAKIKGDLGIIWWTRNSDDILIGTKGNDTLAGGEGRDTITGGRGDDLIVNNSWWNPNESGDGSRDLLIFRAGDGRDTVYGFDTNLDRLDVGGRSYDLSRNPHDGRVDFTIDFGGGDVIKIMNAAPGTLDIF